jgi:hypothetical protein
MQSQQAPKKSLVSKFQDWLFTPSTKIEDKVKNVAAGFLIHLVWVFIIITPFFGWLFSVGQFETPLKAIFFFSCILAPLWEELAFRVIPITIAKEYGKQYILPVVILSSLIFGWGHGMGPISLLIQGVMGFVMAIVYIKNNYSYWSSVALHSMWNTYIYLITF